MSGNKNNNPENDQNKAGEPEVAFKTIRIFNSFEEQENEEIRWLASLTHEQYLQNTTSLVKRVFSEDLKKHPKLGNQIHFK